MIKLILPIFLFSNLFAEQILKLQDGKNNVVNNISIDVKKTFNNRDIAKVELYDKVSKKYAQYPFIKDKLQLNEIENGVEFYVYAKKNIDIKLHIEVPSKVCQNLMDNKKYNYLEDSGIDKKATIDQKSNIAISSRYYSNQLKGKYTNTKVVLIYPNIKTTSKMKYKYGPGLPKVIINYSKEYENKKFYIYDFFEKGCFQGYFPSVKMPPFRELRRID